MKREIIAYVARVNIFWESKRSICFKQLIKAVNVTILDI